MLYKLTKKHGHILRPTLIFNNQTATDLWRGGVIGRCTQHLPKKLRSGDPCSNFYIGERIKIKNVKSGVSDLWVETYDSDEAKPNMTVFVESATGSVVEFRRFYVR